MDPGVIPPISAWWPRLATKNTGFGKLLKNIVNNKKALKQKTKRKNRFFFVDITIDDYLWKTGVITVRSGKWEPPADGWLAKMTSPRSKLPLNALIWYCTVSCIAPKWTGMWGALETNPPSGPKTAHEKSRRSLMFVEMEVRWRILKQFLESNDELNSKRTLHF